MRLHGLVSSVFVLAACATDSAPDTSDVQGTEPEAEIALEASELGRHNELRQRLQSGLDVLRDEGIVGLVGAVSDGRERITASSGVARLGDRQPVPHDSQFRIGSNTKTFIAVVVLQLAEEGVLDIDDSVERWLPGLVTGNGNDGTKISIRHLLQHTSGIFNYTQEMLATFTYEDYLAKRFVHFEPEELVQIALGHEPYFPPGEGWRYSNTGYILLGMIIERASGNNWRDEVRRRIIAPLQLSKTFDPVTWPGVPAPLHGYNEFVPGEPVRDVTVFEHSWADAAGSLISTASDLTRFWRALQAGELLEPASMAAMHQTVPAPDLEVAFPGARYGLGILWIETRCGGYWSHFGDTHGFATRNAVDDTGRRAIAFSENTAFGSLEKVLQVIGRDLDLLESVMCAGR